MGATKTDGAMPKPGTRNVPRLKIAGPTRDRIVEAARQEFLAYGFAGARIDRIARRAKTSKERIYHYFKGKAHLADTVTVEQAERLAEMVKFDPQDIDSFIGDLFDFYFDNPDEVRLWLWFLLEKGDQGLPDDDLRVEAIKGRLESGRRAQAGGQIDPIWNPILLLDLLIGLAVSRVIAPAYVQEVAEKELGEAGQCLSARHRAAVIEISHRLLANAPKSALSPK